MIDAGTDLVVQGAPMGVHAGIPIDEYHRSPALSCSGLHDFARSPFHYHALHINPRRPRQPERAGQLEGNLAHCAILEPSTYDERYAIGAGEDKRLKAWKDLIDHLEQTGDRRTVIKPSQDAAAQAMAMSVRSIPDVAELLAQGAPELSAFWTDQRTGVYCRCRPDWVHWVSDRRVILLDVKTFSDASPAEFARQIPRKGYHRQAAWYSEGFARASGFEVMAFVFVVVETEWPFAASAAMLDEQSLEAAHKDNVALRERFAQCQRTDTWPAFSGIQLVTLPPWAFTKEDPYA
jgi:hypothetical protein